MTAQPELLTECPDTWLARRLEAGLPAEVWKGVHVMASEAGGPRTFAIRPIRRTG